MWVFKTQWARFYAPADARDPLAVGDPLRLLPREVGDFDRGDFARGDLDRGDLDPWRGVDAVAAVVTFAAWRRVCRFKRPITE